jgi:hypothetical protein
VSGNTLLLILVPFAFLAGGLAVFMAMSARNDVHALEGRRPWWGNPLLWVVVSVGLAFLGLVIAPRLFGVAFLLLPLIWVGGIRRRERR